VVLQRLGERLRSFVTPLGWPELATQVRQATEQGRRVLLTVRSAAAELYALPWELLTLKASGQHVGELADVLLRYEWPDTATAAEKPLPRRGGGRVLLAWSAAGGAVPAAEHVQAIAAACRASCHPFDEERDVLSQVSMGRLSDTLFAAKAEGRPISILHLLCHGAPLGGSFGLVFDGETAVGGAAPVDAGRLRQLLGQHADMVRLVVLMACDSSNSGPVGNQLGSVAQALHQAGVSAVVASRLPLSTLGSVHLARSLYTSLLPGLKSLEQGLLAARTELAKDAGQLDWVSLQLYARVADGADCRPLVFRPYPGLSAFGREARRFFFGREALTDKLWNRCQELLATPGSIRLLTVLGPSGSGKSSVARAGLLAEVAHRPLVYAGQPPSAGQTRLVVFTPGAHPLRALAAALTGEPAADTDAPLLILVDQFEEIYTLCADATECDAFVNLLLLAARTPGLPALVVLTLRSDFIGETQRRHPELNRLFDEQAKIVTVLSIDELRSSIANPAARLGQPIDEATIELLLSEAQGREGALPLLSFALSQVWEGMLAGQTPAATLHAIGGVGGALAGRAQEIYGALSVAEQATARRALVRLVKLGEGTRDTRRRAPLGELCGRGESEVTVLSVLRKLCTESARLVTLSNEGAATTAEVTHEALFDHWRELSTWIDQSRADRGLQDRAMDVATRWHADGRPAGRLWRTPDLEQLRDYQQRKPDELSPLQEQFLAAGVRQQRQEKRFRVGSVLLILVALSVAVGVYNNRSKRLQEQLLDLWVERGQRLLFEDGSSNESLLWLSRAHAGGSSDPVLPDLLKSAMQGVDATKAVLVGHGDHLLSATYSPDGRRIVTASSDRTARVWEAEGGRLLAELKGHGSVVWNATFSPDGQRIATASADKTARIWETASGRLLVTLTGHGNNVSSATFSPDGQRIVTTSQDQTARIWETQGGRLLAELKGHGDHVRRAAFSPDGQRIVTASADHTARVWEAEGGRLLAELKGHGDSVWEATFSPDGRLIVTASQDRTARVWAADGGRLLRELTGHGDNVHSAVFSRDGRRIVTASADKTARVWDVESGSLLAKLAGYGSGVNSATFSPDGRLIVTGCEDKTARVWEAAGGHLLRELTGHGERVVSASFEPDGRRIVTASADKTARVWEVDGGRLLAELKGHDSSINGATFSPDGRRIVTSGDDNIARIWQSEGGHLAVELTGHADRVTSATFSPEGRRVVTTSADQTSRVWDAQSGRILVELTGQGAIKNANFSPDGRRIVTTGAGHTARVWDADSGRFLTELGGPGFSVNSAIYSPDSQHIVTANSDSTVRVWAADDGRPLAELKGHGSLVTSAEYSRDGRCILTASADHTARVWTADGHLLLELRGHGFRVNSATFSPDGRRIITLSDDSKAQVWATESGRLLAEFKGIWSFGRAAMFSPDSKRIVTAGGVQTARVWEADSGRLLAELRGHGSGVYSAAFSPDGWHIVTASADKTVRVWDVSPETRTPKQLAALIRCRVPVRFERDDSNLIVPTMPNPAECLSNAR
jgi:WD40 repeat protein